MAVRGGISFGIGGILTRVHFCDLFSYLGTITYQRTAKLKKD